MQCFPGQLNQVFMNLLANAIDAFDEVNQGKSFAEIEANPNRITIETEKHDRQQVRIRITDNGCGMKPETVDRIFEQGFTTKAIGKGTGLGMAIALSIIEEKHGGRIRCRSQLGKGTEFTIAIPLHFPG
ncbi:ATP-binding protein [Roseofilum sp. BLCC_M143]|uniref:histidine kinase n=1 Tax=Roseofilum casamattae BLCC-M143 TaxID=3022442 RepID=A0ABT7BVD0_9CYAN|nr:ATP-binding protein [Roseofilum casamattae]MDJ1182464.1 ATP-binding protein [Roseofilum casamattae BLCC-M143]